MSAYVLDASVAAKWVLPPAGETLVEPAFDLLHRFTTGHIQLAVPDLFWLEVGNILWKAVRVERMSELAAKEAIRLLWELRIPTSTSATLLNEAFAIAITYQRTVYDSTYVALAVVSSRSLVTADERLVNSLGSRFPIRWLGSLS